MIAASGIGGCGAGGDAASADAAPRHVDVDGFDVLVSSTGVTAYAHFNAGNASDSRFAQQGECAYASTDSTISVQSCVQHLRIGATDLQPTATEGLANPFTAAGVTAATTLEITGCDRTVTVPIDAGPYPAATALRTERSGTDLVVTWSAPAAASALVGVSGGYGAYTCHDMPSGAYRFVDRDAVQGVAEVQTFGPPETTQTELGAVHVWYGEITQQTLAMPRSVIPRPRIGEPSGPDRTRRETPAPRRV